MKKLTKLVNAVIVLSLFTGLLILSSCGTDVQQKEISLKGEKITASYMQALNNAAYSSSDRTTNSFEVYEVNTNSPKAKIVEQKLTSILKDSLTKSSKISADLNGPQEPTLSGGPNMEEAAIYENTEIGRQALFTPISDGSDTYKKYTVSGYNEIANSIEKTVVVTIQSNYSSAELNANPQLIEQAELTVLIESQTGQLLYSHTYTAQNFNTAAATVAASVASCYVDCMGNMGYLSTFELFIAQTTAALVTVGASGPIQALGIMAGLLGMHVGCGWGCLLAWIFY